MAYCIISVVLVVASLLAGCNTTKGTVLGRSNTTIKTEQQGDVIKVYTQNEPTVIFYPRPFAGEWVGTDPKTGDSIYIRTEPW